jgi:hypothetical protein
MVRIMLGLAICVILFLSARRLHAQDVLVRSGVLYIGRASPIFRLLVGVLGMLIAYGLWRNYPWASLPSLVNLISYLLMVIGLLSVLISYEPMRIGLGLLTFVNGFETMYFFLEPSFVVIGILGMTQIMVALAVAFFSEAWLGEPMVREEEE